MKKIIYLAAAFLCMACSDDHESDQQHGGASGSVTEVTPVTSDLSVGLSTDKAFYKPGERWYLRQTTLCLPEPKYVIAFRVKRSERSR